MKDWDEDFLKQPIPGSRKSSEFWMLWKSQRAEPPPPTEDSWPDTSAKCHNGKLMGSPQLIIPAGPIENRHVVPINGSCQHHNEDLITLKCCQCFGFPLFQQNKGLVFPSEREQQQVQKF